MTDLRGRCSSSKLSLSVCLNKFTKRSEKCSPITQPATAFCIDENLDAVSGLVNVLTVINKGLLLSLFLIVFFAASQIKYTLFQGYQICLLLLLSEALESCDISLRASQTDIPKVILTCCQARLFHIRPPELRQTSAKAGKLASLRTHNNFSLSLLLMCPGLFLVPLFLFYSHQNHHSS